MVPETKYSKHNRFNKMGLVVLILYVAVTRSTVRVAMINVTHSSYRSTLLIFPHCNTNNPRIIAQCSWQVIMIMQTNNHINISNVSYVHIQIWDVTTNSHPKFNSGLLNRLGANKSLHPIYNLRSTD